MKSDICNFCNGTGMINRSQKCLVCDGSGIRNNNERCPYCFANLSIENHNGRCRLNPSHPINHPESLR